MLFKSDRDILYRKIDTVREVNKVVAHQSVTTEIICLGYIAPHVNWNFLLIYEEIACELMMAIHNFPE